MYNLISRFLCYLPGNLLGSASKDAARTLAAWTRNNRTLAEYKPSRMTALLYWGSEHAAAFTLLSAAFSLLVSSLAWPSLEALLAGSGWLPIEVGDFRLSSLAQASALPNVAEFIGVPWGIQATLIALVYPIVISFVAMMLQHRAQASVAMRVYVIDSGVVPAGASALGLLVALTLQYFSIESLRSEYSGYLMALFLFNGTWFALNLGLTSHFLSRTLRFLSPDEQSQAIRRICVTTVLPRDLLNSINSHVLGDALSKVLDCAPPPGPEQKKPRVMSSLLYEGKPAAFRDVRDGYALREAHLGLLLFVARRWYKRAVKHTQTQTQPQPPPTLMFPQTFDRTVRGGSTLCVIANGPSLTVLEAQLVKAAYFFQPPRRGLHDLTASDVLKELGSACQSLADQGQYEQARRAARDLLVMVRTFLHASSFQGNDGPQNVATLPKSAEGWPGPNFHVEWLETFRELVRVAVEHIERDSRLLESLAHVPQLIAGHLPARPEQVPIDSMLVFMHIDYRLTQWWLRHARPRATVAGALSGRNLPAPLDQVYEQVLAQLVGIWSRLPVPLPSKSLTPAPDLWRSASARAKVMSAHLDWSALLVMRAISRADETATVRYCDHFMKWWSLNEYDLSTGALEFEEDLRHVGLSVLELPWEEARWSLHHDGSPATIDRGICVQNLAIRRYWERMRLLLVVTCLGRVVAGPTSVGTLEIQMASALILCRPLKRGADVEAEELHSLDAVLAAILNACFGDTHTSARLENFRERLHQEERAPEVPNWSFGGSWPGSSMEALTAEYACLLVSISDGGEESINLRESKREVTRWWRDVRKLQSIKWFVGQLLEKVQGPEFQNSIWAVEQLREAMGKDLATGPALESVKRNLETLSKLCSHEESVTLRSLQVHLPKVREYASKLGSDAFRSENFRMRIPTAVKFEPEIEGESLTVSVQREKLCFLESGEESISSSDMEITSKQIFQLAVSEAFDAYVRQKALLPVSSPPIQPGEAGWDVQKVLFVEAVAAECAKLTAEGEAPLVLVPPGVHAGALRKWSWSRSTSPLPAHVVLRDGHATDAFPGASHINDAPVVEFDTPDRACFVVPSSAVKVLAVRGVEGADALSAVWAPHGDAHINIALTWKAVFNSS